MNEVYELMEKSAKFEFQAVKKLFSALHSGARASHLDKSIQHSNKMINNYTGNAGMGWRVNSATKNIEKLTPRLQAHTSKFDDYANTLSDNQRKYLDRGRGVLKTVYDVPKILTFAPTSTTGMVGSMGLYGGAGLMGLNIDPYNRAGQLHGMTNAKDIATNAGTIGGTQAANEFTQGFDSMSMRDRLNFARNPNMISDMVSPTHAAALAGRTGRGFNIESILRGTPDALDGTIRNGIAKEVRNFKL